MAGMKPPRVPDRPVPVFAGDELSRLERACAGRGFQDRRNVAVLKATGIRLSELAQLRFDPDDPRRGGVDLWHWEVTVHGKGRKTRIVKVSHDAALSLDRYLRVRARPPRCSAKSSSGPTSQRPWWLGTCRRWLSATPDST
jgi:integrase